MVLQGQIHFGWHSTKKIEMYLYSRQICLINKLFCLISFRLCAHFRSFDNSNTCSTFRSIIDISNESSFMLSTESNFVFTKWFLFIEAIFLKMCIKSITPIGMIYLVRYTAYLNQYIIIICREFLIKRCSFYPCTKCLCDIRFFYCQTDKGRIKGLDTRKFISRMLEKYRTIKNNG